MKKRHSYSGGRLRLLIFTITLLIVSIICLYESTSLSDDYTEEEPTSTEEPVEIKSETVKVKQVGSQEIIKPVCSSILYDTSLLSVQNDSLELDTNDRYLLAKIAMAEAEGESTEGKALVMLVVLNRLKDSEFPDTIGEVIFEHRDDVYQFTTVQEGGRFYNNEPNDDCWKALRLIESGWDESQGALYFESAVTRDTWHNRNLELLFEEGGHQFYK